MVTQEPCAVVNCPEHGGPQVCPYDKKYHRHGRIHYDCGYPVHSVTFHPIEEGWFYVCNSHYALLKLEREAFEARQA